MTTETPSLAPWAVKLNYIPARRIVEWLIGALCALVAWATDAPSLIYFLIGAILFLINLVYGLRLIGASQFRFNDVEVVRRRVRLRWDDVKSGTRDTYFAVLTLIPERGNPLAISFTAYKDYEDVLARIGRKLKTPIAEDRSGELLDDVFH